MEVQDVNRLPEDASANAGHDEEGWQDGQKRPDAGRTRRRLMGGRGGMPTGGARCRARPAPGGRFAWRTGSGRAAARSSRTCPARREDCLDCLAVFPGLGKKEMIPSPLSSRRRAETPRRTRSDDPIATRRASRLSDWCCARQSSRDFDLWAQLMAETRQRDVRRSARDRDRLDRLLRLRRGLAPAWPRSCGRWSIARRFDRLRPDRPGMG